MTFLALLAATAASLVGHVDPLIGTTNDGNTFPGPAAPFGMVQLSPDNGGFAGYDHDKGGPIRGFSQTHLSGVGCLAAGEVPILPVAGPVVPHAATAFAHADETARLGDYRVKLADGVGVELTAGSRTGWHRFTFPAGRPAHVLVKSAVAGGNKVTEHAVRLVGTDGFEGKVTVEGFCGGEGVHTVFFAGKFDRAAAGTGTFGDGVWARFDTTKDRDVVLVVALSYTSVAGARANLTDELAGFDFDGTRARLIARWEPYLGRVVVEGGSDADRTVFYTALYHAFLHPNLASDVGQPIRYQNYSLWDTFRPQNQLLALLAPEVARETYLSLLAEGQKLGTLPRWSLAGSETNVMNGDSATPFLVEGWSKGLLAGHEEEAWQAMRRHVLGPPPAPGPVHGRAVNDLYDRHGYVPFGVPCHIEDGDDDCRYPGSVTLEYAAADAALAIMAKALGHTEDAARLTARAGAFRRLFDPFRQVFRPRDTDGMWLFPYNPLDGGGMFQEGSAIQYLWLVPHDPRGLVELLGGKKKAEARLDHFFRMAALIKDPTAGGFVSDAIDYFGHDSYNPHNEPDLIAPFLYAWVGAPAKVVHAVRAAQRLFTTKPSGVTGNDDLGTMSSWYVFSALGFFPVMSGSNTFVLTSPRFARATVTLADGPLVITAPEVSDARPFVSAVKIGATRLARAWITWDELRKAGTLAFTVAAKPTRWATAASAIPPSPVPTVPDPARHLIAATFGAKSYQHLPTDGPQKLYLGLAVESAKTLRATITFAAPPGWTVEPRTTTQTIPVKPHPANVDLPVVLTPPTPTPLGEAIVTATVTAPGMTPATAQTVIDVRAPTCARVAGTQCALDLSRERDVRGAGAAPLPSGGFDGSGRLFSAQHLPRAGAFTFEGVTYDAPEARGDGPSFVRSNGQVILVPPGRHHAHIRVLAASHHGDFGGPFVVHYTEGPDGELPFDVPDWAHMPPPAKAKVAIPAPRRHSRSDPEAKPVAIFAIDLAIDPTRSVRAIRLPSDRRVTFYAITLD